MSETYQAETQIAAGFLGDMYARWTLDCHVIQKEGQSCQPAALY